MTSLLEVLPLVLPPLDATGSSSSSISITSLDGARPFATASFSNLRLGPARALPEGPASCTDESSVASPRLRLRLVAGARAAD